MRYESGYHRAYLRWMRTSINWATVGRIDYPMSPFAGNVLASEGMDDGADSKRILGESRLADGAVPVYLPDEMERRRRWAGRLPFPQPRTFT